MDTTIEFKVYGKFALFTDPMTKMGGEKYSMMIPTYEALKGICESIYWKPTIKWVIDKVRIVNPIRMETKSILPMTINGKRELAYYTYLKDAHYEVKAHFEFNEDFPELKYDYNIKKHLSIAKRSIKKGGRFDVFLGTRECYAYIEPCEYGEEDSYYEKEEELSFGLMFHGFNYPNKKIKVLESRFWNPVMKYGEINFIRPNECKVIRRIREYKTENEYENGINFNSVEKEIEEYKK